MTTNSTVSILIVYTANCGAYLRFFYWSAEPLSFLTTIEVVTSNHKLTSPSIRRAVRGDDPHLLNFQQDLAAYDREDTTRYPYKSHWQWARAAYGMIACGLMAFFNGWRSIKPWAGSDFVASYISVSH